MHFLIRYPHNSLGEIDINSIFVVNKQKNMKSYSDKILESIKHTLMEHLPKGAKALLYGSQARGDARVDSDWDILIIIDKEKLEPDDYDKVSYPLTVLGWDLGARINPIMYTMKEWAASCITPFYKNVEQEGIELV